jgi:hypothetical protein
MLGGEFVRRLRSFAASHEIAGGTSYVVSMSFEV